MAPSKTILAGLATMVALGSALPNPLGRLPHNNILWSPEPPDTDPGLYPPYHNHRPIWEEPPEFPATEPSVALYAPTTSMITEVHTSYLHLTTSPSFDKPTTTSVAVTTITGPFVAIETSVEVRIESVLLTTSASASTLVSSSSSSATTPAFPVTSAPPYESCEEAQKRVSSWYNALIYTDAHGGLHKPPPSWGRVMPGECGPRRLSARDEREASLALTMSNTKSDEGTHSGPHLGPVDRHRGGPGRDDSPEAMESARSWFSEYQKTRETTVYTTLVQGTASILSILTIQTPTLVPTTMVTELLMVTVTAGGLPTETTAELPAEPSHLGCHGRDCPYMKPCPPWGCARPCRDEDCIFGALPLPLPAPIEDPIPSSSLPSFPPEPPPPTRRYPRPPRPSHVDLPKKPFLEAGTGPVDAQQE